MDPFYSNGIVREDQYAQTMRSLVQPALQAIRIDRLVPGFDGRDLHVTLCPAENARGTIILVHGFTENGEKFSEIIHAFHLSGYTVAVHDARGHGRSWRDPKVASLSDTYVHCFDDYVKDLDTLLATVYRELPGPKYLVCHSMGGAVSALYLEEHPDAFQKAVLNAPMIAPNTGGIPKGAAVALCTFMKGIGRGKRPIMGSKGYTGHEDFDTSCTTCRSRFDWYDEMKFHEPLFQNTSPTYGWTLEAVRVTDRILKKGEVEKLTLPVLVMQASEDNSVLNEPMDAFVQRLPNGRKIRFEGARHEIFRCKDTDVCRWMDEILAFLAD